VVQVDEPSGSQTNRRPSISDLLTLLIAVGSLAISWLTYRNAADTTDIKAAIGNLSDLATQTKRQADATHDQLAAVRDQVSALRDQADEAKRQTAAIASQTEAIKASSDAAIRQAEANVSAAQAQQKMAEVTAQAQKPDVDVAEISVSGLNAEPDKDGNVQFSLFWRFRDTGGSALTVKDIIFGLQIAAALTKEMPTGTRLDGEGIVLTNSITSSFSPKEPLQMKMPKDTRDALTRGDAKLFFFAKLDYLDNLKGDHSRCFGRELILKDGSSVSAIPSGGEAYQCAS
jgi:hypothetical protein